MNAKDWKHLQGIIAGYVHDQIKREFDMIFGERGPGTIKDIIKKELRYREAYPGGPPGQEMARIKAAVNTQLDARLNSLGILGQRIATERFVRNTHDTHLQNHNHTPDELMAIVKGALNTHECSQPHFGCDDIQAYATATVGEQARKVAQKETERQMMNHYRLYHDPSYQERKFRERKNQEDRFKTQLGNHFYATRTWKHPGCTDIYKERRKA